MDSLVLKDLLMAGLALVFLAVLSATSQYAERVFDRRHTNKPSRKEMRVFDRRHYDKPRRKEKDKDILPPPQRVSKNDDMGYLGYGGGAGRGFGLGITGGRGRGYYDY